VTDFAGGRVVRVDPGGGKVTRSPAVCAGVQDLQVHAGAVWGACMKGERLVGFDPQTLRVVGRVPHRADPADELDSPALSRKGAQGVCIFWS
jgi:hypothetical protein